MARKAKNKGSPRVMPRFRVARLAAAAALALVGGWLAFTLAVAGVTRIKNPQAALSFMPSDSTALAARADQILLANPAKPAKSIGTLARKALIGQAINPKALRQLGYMADARGDQRQALKLVNMSAKLSRRDSYAQLWLIEYYAQADDTATTLRHYDIALTTKLDVSALLYPRLDVAVSDADVRTALVPYLRNDRPWMSNFVWHAINSETDLGSLVSLIAEAKGLSKSDTSQRQLLALLSKLTVQKRFAEAQQIFGLILGSQRALLTNPAFADSDRDGRFGAMGWVIADDPSAGGGFFSKKGSGAPALSLFANSGTTRIVASRLLFLAPGNYQFSTTLSRIERGDGGYLQFQLRCLEGAVAAPFWVMNVATKSANGPVVVPSNCGAQSLDIVASGGQGQLGLEGVVGKLRLS
jgi:hypothetical protein